MAAAVFGQCKEAETPLHTDDTGWAEWPEDCAEPDVLHWLRHHIDQFLQFANEQGFQPPTRRRCFATPNKHIPGSVSKRKLDIGIIYGRRNETSDDGAPCDWCDVLVPGELKSNPREDNHSSTWFDLSRYAREIFVAQDTRRSVTGFTLCGSIMRLWAFDQLGAECTTGAISSGWHHKATALCGRMSDDLLEVHDKSGKPFVVKDSWEFEERPEEGPLLKKVTDAGVENVAEYHHHEIVHDEGDVVDIRNKLRKGLEDGGGRYPLRGHPNSQTLADLSKAEGHAADSSEGRILARSLVIYTIPFLKWVPTLGKGPYSARVPKAPFDTVVDRWITAASQNT
ncbi:uncharacterized protein BDZ99DRAFT_482788 [Mytilinidion resinicola]|uniref:Fungal-type protein kinase domain-containing protein n=1 Tax=Mytilinidion resinicola TaxID=574789 RepID=A0A6A6Y2C4_9PEZI|nr:uncharacterized protein BDZ99DRAFT_482788 [Mytilinidion resinicola]KAF2802663.1 hypothetical protein BDZ99DRAFT_482788 [Mytilinidion resinicola]